MSSRVLDDGPAVVETIFEIFIFVAPEESRWDVFHMALALD